MRSEAQALQDEERDLLNEARFMSEPAFAEYKNKLQVDLKEATYCLIYETTEPRRSMLQGRCQQLTETIQRPEAVQARLGAVRERLETLRAEAFSRADGVTVAGGTGP